MLLKLYYRFQFTTTTKIIKGEIDFEQGITSITGPNERGKSMVMEAVRYNLFGTEALRMPLSGYVKIETDQLFMVKDKTYRLSRTHKSATLWEVIDPTDMNKDVALATGTGPVNKTVIKLFGYGLAVFDIAHFCNQNKVEALTDMKATERKKMVDRVIGLDALDVAAAAVTEDATVARGTLKGMEMGLGKPPEAPEKPTPYVDSAVLDENIALFTSDLPALQEARGYLSANLNCHEPVPPTPTGQAMTADKMEQYEQSRDRVIAERDALSAKLAGVPAMLGYGMGELNAMEQQWHEHEDWLKAVEYARRHGACPWWCSAETLQKIYDDRKDWDEWSHLNNEIKLLKDITVKCPDCGSTHPVDPVRIAQMEETLYAMPGGEEVPWTQGQLRDLHQDLIAWTKPEADALRDALPADRPPLLRAEIKAQRLAWAMQPLRDRLEAITIPISHAADLRAQREYEMRWEQYLQDRDTWSQHETLLKKAKETVGKLRDTEGKLERLRLARDISREYETRLASYENAKEKYDTSLAKLNELRDEVEQFKRGSEAIKILRKKIKTFLVPSLNVAASDLLSRMTGGERSAIKVDEDFEKILVDGQPIESLSGSAKAVSNLAIRLGLGQVLTNRVFSVFMGDEIDASMDADRAGYTAECLNGLSGVIKQIILISHKDLPVQHQIKIG